jgi:hypothetical protein
MSKSSELSSAHSNAILKSAAPTHFYKKRFNLLRTNSQNVAGGSSK